jgi:hypothetical protein
LLGLLDCEIGAELLALQNAEKLGEEMGADDERQVPRPNRPNNLGWRP